MTLPRIYLSPPHMSGLEQQFVQETFASKTTASTTSCRPSVADSCACWSKGCSANGKSSRSTAAPWLTVITPPRPPILGEKDVFPPELGGQGAGGYDT